MHDPTISTIRVNGGRLCLDFVNTATWADGRPDWDFLGGFADVLNWGGRQGLIGQRELPTLRQHANGADAAKTLARIKELRSALRDLFEPARSATRIKAALAVLNDRLARDANLLTIEATVSGFRLVPGARLDGWLTAPVAVAALELATSPDRARVGVCAGDGCGWLFLDQSRNGVRRWCSMESCGNRAKARAHYLAHRAGRQP